jgi:hypothetical protein
MSLGGLLHPTLRLKFTECPSMHKGDQHLGGRPDESSFPSLASKFCKRLCWQRAVVVAGCSIV